MIQNAALLLAGIPAILREAAPHVGYPTNKHYEDAIRRCFQMSQTINGIATART